jgi:hypothetical protein
MNGAHMTLSEINRAATMWGAVEAGELLDQWLDAARSPRSFKVRKALATRAGWYRYQYTMGWEHRVQWRRR